jgi:hypothetical protein
MEIKINSHEKNNEKNNETINIDNIKFQKMVLLYNAIEEGWTIKKRNNKYYFIKKHEEKKEFMNDNYLIKFIETSSDITNLLSI